MRVWVVVRLWRVYVCEFIHVYVCVGGGFGCDCVSLCVLACV